MTEPLITFESRAGWYGLRARDILEVARLDGLRPVPRAPGIVAGLAEVHGRLVTLIDFDRLLAAGPGSADGMMGVVLAPPRDHLAILVRSGIDVASPVGTDLSDEADEGGLLRGCLPIGDHLVNVIDLAALVSRVEEAVREGVRPGADGSGEEE
jgi:chemotaxis signal transduction protein